MKEKAINQNPKHGILSTIASVPHDRLTCLASRTPAQKRSITYVVATSVRLVLIKTRPGGVRHGLASGSTNTLSTYGITVCVCVPGVMMNDLTQAHTLLPAAWSRAGIHIGQVHGSNLISEMCVRGLLITAQAGRHHRGNTRFTLMHTQQRMAHAFTSLPTKSC